MKKRKTFKIFPLALFFAFLFPQAARPAFEDIAFSARGLGLADSLCAVDGMDSMNSNPASMGRRRKFVAATHFVSSRRTPQGDANLMLYTAAALFPKMLHARNGTLGLLASYRQNPNLSKEMKMQLGWATWHLLEASYGVLDFGTNLKILNFQTLPEGNSAMALSADLGSVLRMRDSKNLGLSFLNLTNPSFDAVSFKDKAPFVVKLGYAEERGDYNLSADFSRRSGSAGSDRSYSLNTGFEYFWRGSWKGYLKSFGGLSLGDNSSAFSLGASYKISAAEISYALQIPLTRSVILGHALSLNLEFGGAGLESEYEKMMRREVKYRKDLLGALDEAARREAVLKEEINNLRKETDDLNARLSEEALKNAEQKKYRDRLEKIIERKKLAEKRMKELKEKRRRDRINQLEFSFSRDFESYLRLKASSPPRDVLKGMLERTIKEYQGQGIDISRATMELQKVISGNY